MLETLGEGRRVYTDCFRVQRNCIVVFPSFECFISLFFDLLRSLLDGFLLHLWVGCGWRRLWCRLFTRPSNRRRGPVSIQSRLGAGIWTKEYVRCSTFFGSSSSPFGLFCFLAYHLTIALPSGLDAACVRKCTLTKNVFGWHVDK